MTVNFNFISTATNTTWLADNPNWDRLVTNKEAIYYEPSEEVLGKLGEILIAGRDLNLVQLEPDTVITTTHALAYALTSSPFTVESCLGGRKLIFNKENQ